MNRIRRHTLIGAANKYNLTYTDNNAIFYKRRTANGAIIESKPLKFKVDEIRGKSIVWNQMVENGNFIDATGWNFTKNIVSTFLEGGGVKCTIADKNAYHQITRGLNATIPNGHKVLLRLLHKTPSEVNVILIGNPNYVIWKEIHGQGNIEYEAAAFVTTLGKDLSNVEIRIDTQIVSSTPVDVYLSKYQIFDLTLMFGAGNEPATPEEFEAMFPLDYYDYNAGEVIPFAGQNLVTTGFNMLKVKGRVEHVGPNLTPIDKRTFSEGEYWNGFAYDGYFQNNKKHKNLTLDEGQVSGTAINNSYGIGFPIKCEPNTQYYYKTTYGNIGFFDKEGVNIDHFGGLSGVFTTPANAVWMVIVVGRTIGAYTESNLVVNISNTNINGIYKPYKKYTLPLDPANWRDKQGNLVYPYGGMHGVGTAYDYAKVDADGYIRKAVRCFGQVDLGSLNWSTPSIVVNYPVSNTRIRNIKLDTHRLISAEYIEGPFGINKTIHGHATYNTLYVSDSAIDGMTDSEVKAYMTGKMLIYELVEPVEVELATPTYVKGHAHSYGTEEIIPENTQIPYTTPAHMGIEYYSKK